MWFAKWFGARRTVEEDDEPARFPPTPAAMNGAPDPRTVTKTPVPPKGPTKPANGFDPYNTGGFERRNAWERVIRR